MKKNYTNLYFLNDEEEIIFHYIPIMLEHKKIDISPNIWVTALDIYVEETVDNIGENCIPREEYTKSGLLCNTTTLKIKWIQLKNDSRVFDIKKFEQNSPIMWTALGLA